MKVLLMVASIGEAATGLVLLAYPPIVTRLLFNQTVDGAGDFMSRIAGISLIALGVACWPGRTALQPLYGMLSYSTLVMLLLIIAGLGGAAGILLWPAMNGGNLTSRKYSARVLAPVIISPFCMLQFVCSKITAGVHRHAQSDARGSASRNYDFVPDWAPGGG